MHKIIIICGPTAIGKTRAGIELAKEFGGEIVSADSQQVWRGFNVGTAKPSREELALVPHHLVDVCEPEEHFDAARFVKLADDAIADIASRGKTPLVVGGTGMYIRMLVHGFCEAPPQDNEFRAQLEEEIERIGIASLHERLKELDPESAEKIKPNDRTRIIRALEIHYLTGMPASRFRREHNFNERRYDAQKIGLDIDRAELYRRIDARVDLMIADGLVDEVRVLLARHDEKCQPFQAVGYREIVSHLKGDLSLEDAVSLIKKNTRHFAKRQLTWFKADSEIKWFNSEESAKIVENIKKHFESDGLVD